MVDGAGNSALILAAENNQEEAVRALLDMGARVDHRNKEGRTAVMVAAGAGHAAVVAALIAAKADLAVLDREGRSATDHADLAGHADLARSLAEAGSPVSMTAGPAEARRISDEAAFLTWETLPPALDAAARDEIAGLPLTVRLERSVLRAVSLPFYAGAYLLAVEDMARKGRREQFCLWKPSGATALLDWTNEAIYQFNERLPLVLTDEWAVSYARFFFHFVRGQIGRFILVERDEEIPWTPAVTDNVRQEVGRRLHPVRFVERPEPDLIVLEATVIFKNALFSSKILVALAPREVLDEELGQREKFSLGQFKLFGEDLLLEDLPVHIDKPPGVFG
jgi:hypothetical protein